MLLALGCSPKLGACTRTGVIPLAWLGASFAKATWSLITFSAAKAASSWFWPPVVPRPVVGVILRPSDLTGSLPDSRVKDTVSSTSLSFGKVRLSTPTSFVSPGSWLNCEALSKTVGECCRSWAPLWTSGALARLVTWGARKGTQKPSPACAA